MENNQKVSNPTDVLVILNTIPIKNKVFNVFDSSTNSIGSQSTMDV